MPFLDCGDASIFYDVAGSGPALIFAHGLGGNHISWWQQVPHFRDRYTCVTFAHRGFSPSREEPGGDSFASIATSTGALDASGNHRRASSTYASARMSFEAGDCSA